MSLAHYYKTIGDESRLRILNILHSGHLSVQELTSILNLAQPTVSHHLKTLTQDGFLKSSRDGTKIFYTLNNDSSNTTLQLVTNSALKACQEATEHENDSVFKKDAQQVQRLLEKRRADSKKYFDNVAKDWSDLRSSAFGNENFLDQVTELIEPKACVLELGCGSGALLNMILPRPGKTIGVDYSESMLQECRQNLATKGQACDLRLGYMEHLPVGDESVDCVIAYMSLHHVPNPREVFAEVKRVLKNEGQFIIVDLVAHEDETMRERFADIWLGFEPKELQQWLGALDFRSTTQKILGKAKNIFLLTTLK